jgi:hypothetical protein
MRARRGARRTAGRGRYLGAMVAMAGLAAAATSCESDSKFLVNCQVLGQQRQSLHTELLPDDIYDGSSAQLTIAPELVTGVPGDDSARVVGVDFEFPLPHQAQSAYASVLPGGNILGRAFVQDGKLRVRYAGGAATLGDLSLPKVQLQVYLASGQAGSDLVFRVPSRIEVTVEWNGALGLDTCVPADPSAGLISAPLKPWSPPPPGSWGTFPPGSYPPGSYPPGTYPPEANPGSRVIAVVTGTARPDPAPEPATTTTTHAAHDEGGPTG